MNAARRSGSIVRRKLLFDILKVGQALLVAPPGLRGNVPWLGDLSCKAFDEVSGLTAFRIDKRLFILLESIATDDRSIKEGESGSEKSCSFPGREGGDPQTLKGVDSLLAVRQRILPIGLLEIQG